MDNLIIRNAAGTAKTVSDVRTLCNSAVNEITLGSMTWLPRSGNQGTTTGFNERESAYTNALGLPNMGFEKYMEVLFYIATTAQCKNKKLVASVAGFSPQEYTDMALGCYQRGVDLVEFNFGCPNVWGDGGRKPIPSYDPELARDILQHAAPMLRSIGQRVSVKISPVKDDRVLAELADVMLESNIVCEIVGCNTIPDQDLLLEDGTHALSFMTDGDDTVKHVGGLSGKPLYTESLAIAGMLRTWLPNSIRVVAAGGIFTGTDAQGYLDKGAAGFECAAALMVYGPKIFGDIAQELANM